MIQDLGHIQAPTQPLVTITEGLVTYTTEVLNPVTKTHDQVQVLYLRTPTARKISIFKPLSLEPISANSNLEITFTAVAKHHDLPQLNLLAPWPLETCQIAKPWGAEIWFTGIEARGVCRASNIALPHLLNLLPKQDTGSAQNSAPLLLKILAPHADANMGDLYFELHEQKVEVYIVTAIDEDIWPEGVGQIRYGFDQDNRSRFASDDEFKAAYLLAVKQYQRVRNSIDSRLDQRRADENIDINTEVDSKTMTRWLSEVPEDLQHQEHQLKAEMDSFTHVRDLRLGDVVTVAPYFPHSLQHGVRVIEFQTASYERHILSFNQKVLTQAHWDTNIGLDLATLDAAPDDQLMIIEQSSEVLVELVADFDAFHAVRVTLEANSVYKMPPRSDYSLAITVAGNIIIEANQTETKLQPENSVFLPPNNPYEFSTTERSVLLIAEPKSS